VQSIKRKHVGSAAAATAKPHVLHKSAVELHDNVLPQVASLSQRQRVRRAAARACDVAVRRVVDAAAVVRRCLLSQYGTVPLLSCAGSQSQSH
jgi:hypothetical protein